MTSDELKSMPKGQFVVMKTGAYPMKVKLKLFYEWGIKFSSDYNVKENGNRKVEYADKDEIIKGIMKKYHDVDLDDIPPNAIPVENGGQTHITQTSRRKQPYRKCELRTESPSQIVDDENE